MRWWLLVPIVIAACSDSSATATKPPADAGKDDATASDGGTGTSDADVGPTFCSTLNPAPFLCVDFDDAVNPADVFSSVIGAPKVEDKSLHIVSDGTTDIYVEHVADPSPQWSVVELGFSLRVDDVSNDARTTIVRVGQHMTDTECPVELELSSAAITMKGGAADVKLTKTIAKGTTARIIVSMEAGTDAGKVRGNVTVDGQPAVLAPVELGCLAYPGPPRMRLGRIAGAGTSDLRFDDVVFDGH